MTGGPAGPALFLLATLLACETVCDASSPTTELHVCCGCGADNLNGTSRASAFNSLAQAQAVARTLLAAAPAGPPDLTVYVAGVCTVTSSWVLGPADSGVLWTSYPDDPKGPLVSGGKHVLSTAIAPVSDPSVLAALPSYARSQVLEINLTKLGVNNSGSLLCRQYLMSRTLLRSAGLELFSYGDSFAEGDAGPLQLARYPNRNVNVSGWAAPYSWLPGSSDTFVADNTTALRLGPWAAQAAADPGSLMVYWFAFGWADYLYSVASVNASQSTVTLARCNLYPVGAAAAGSVFYVYNALAELDQPGEYVVNRTTGMVYVWPPTPDFFETSVWAAPRVKSTTALPLRTAGGAWAASNATFVVSVADALVQLRDVVNVTFRGWTLSFCRGVGISLVNASDVTLADAVVENTGNTCVNVTGGSRLLIVRSTLRHCGAGGVSLYGGDRHTLTRSDHVVANSSISYANRYTLCYAPLVLFGGVGNTVTGSELFGAFHQAVSYEGNYHTLADSTIHDVVQSVADSGAVYAYGEWSAFGNVVTRNNFFNIHNIFAEKGTSGDMVTTIYLDGITSGFTVTDNTITNAARALLINGGRSNVFVGNKISDTGGFFGVVAVAAYPSASYCGVPGSLGYNSLIAVPWNSSAVWIAAFPELANILNDNPCYPARNIISNNSICGALPCSWSCASYNTAAAPYVWGCCSSPAQIVGWNSSISGNVVNITCPSVSQTTTQSQSLTPSQMLTPSPTQTPSNTETLSRSLSQSPSQAQTSSQTATGSQESTSSQLPTASQARTPTQISTRTQVSTPAASVLMSASVSASLSATLLANATSLGGGAQPASQAGTQSAASGASPAVLGLALGVTFGVLAAASIAIVAVCCWRKRQRDALTTSPSSANKPGAINSKLARSKQPVMMSWRRLDGRGRGAPIAAEMPPAVSVPEQDGRSPVSLSTPVGDRDAVSSIENPLPLQRRSARLIRAGAPALPATVQ